jgi:hypothetical protein
MNLDPSALLVASTEIAVAFVGVANLVRVRFKLRALLGYGLLALPGCGTPLLFGLTELGEPAIWTMSSGLFVVAWIAYVGNTFGWPFSMTSVVYSSAAVV